MKKLISSLLAIGVLVPITVSAQQVNTYQVCHTYQEQYVPGRYTNNGSYIQGGVYTVKNTVNCQTGEVYSSQPYSGSGGSNIVYQPVYQRQRICNPNNSLYGAALGYGLGSALSNGGGWKNSGSWNRYYGRNYSSGKWSNSYTNKSGWAIFGAGMGGLLFSC
jgi:hypothetical protein